MSLPKDCISFEQCIDILESELGDHEPKEPYTKAHITQVMRICIEILKFVKDNADVDGHIDAWI